MSKQKVFTQGDYGLSISTQLLQSDKKTPYNLTNKTVNALVKAEDSTVTKVPCSITNAASGFISFLVTAELTEQTGIHTVNYEINNNVSSITASEADVYFVMADPTQTYNYSSNGVIEIEYDNATEIEKIKHKTDTAVVNAAEYGFVADYVGTPLYDGQDGNRVTCTDNTAAFNRMLDDCIAKKILRVKFPAGHYGIKTGQLLKDMTGCTLILMGDGMDLSVIDFVKEDASNSVYVDETKAKYICRMNKLDTFIIQDMWIKATTNYNNVNGNQADDNAVYYGAVWGMIVDEFKLLQLDRVQISNFNYRGISTMTTGTKAYSQMTYADMSGKILVRDCNFHDNKGSGVWAKDVKEYEVVGGEYHHNGQRGTTGTGYGITASSRVGYLIIRGGARFHHNYRKGFDTHGCINVSVNGATCEDNVVYHFAILGWADITSDGNIEISNLVMKNGYTSDSKAWLDDAYSAITGLSSSQKTGYLFSIDERNQDGSASANKIKTVKFNNVKVLSHYNGADKNPNLQRYIAGGIYATQGISSFIDCDFDFSKAAVSTNTVYGACLFERLTQKYADRNFKINMPTAMTYGAGKFGAVYISGVPTSIEWDNVNIKLAQGYIFGNTAAGEISNTGIGDSVVKKYVNCLFEWDTFPPVATTDNKILGTLAYSGQNNLTMFNNYARIGTSKYKLPNKAGTDFNETFNMWIPSTINASTVFLEIVLEKVTYDTFEIYIGYGINERIVFKNDSATAAALTMVTDGTKMTVSSMSIFTDTDGVDRIKIQLSSKASALGAGMYYGYIRGWSYNYSWGINRITTPIV